MTRSVVILLDLLYAFAHMWSVLMYLVDFFYSLFLCVLLLCITFCSHISLRLSVFFCFALFLLSFSPCLFFFFFFLMIRPPPRSPLFPSPTLSQSARKWNPLLPQRRTDQYNRLHY